MSFDLRIRFAGLMMWVPEGQTAMHVLLPATAGHEHGAHMGRGGVHPHEFDAVRPPAGGTLRRASAAPRSFRPGDYVPVPADAASAPEVAPAAAATAIPVHHARVVYDAAYEQSGATQLTRTYVFADLSRGTLELRRLPTDNGIHVQLPDEIPSLATVAEPVPRELVHGPLDARLAGRVSMDAGGMTFYELSPALVLPGQQTPQRMTAGTEWTIRGIRSRQDAAEGGMEFLPALQILGADGTVIDTIPELYPIADTIQLTVFHTVRTQMPPDGPFNQEATEDDPHFSVYFGISPARVRGGDLTARRGTGLPVVARGKRPDGPQIPSAICVQSRNVLAAS
jgi:hypothetical protein